MLVSCKDRNDIGTLDHGLKASTIRFLVAFVNVAHLGRWLGEVFTEVVAVIMDQEHCMLPLEVAIVKLFA